MDNFILIDQNAVINLLPADSNSSKLLLINALKLFHTSPTGQENSSKAISSTKVSIQMQKRLEHSMLSIREIPKRT